MAEEVFDNPTVWVADHIRRYAAYEREAGRALAVVVVEPTLTGGAVPQ